MKEHHPKQPLQQAWNFLQAHQTQPVMKCLATDRTNTKQKYIIHQHKLLQKKTIPLPEEP